MVGFPFIACIALGSLMKLVRASPVTIMHKSFDFKYTTFLGVVHNFMSLCLMLILVEPVFGFHHNFYSLVLQNLATCDFSTNHSTIWPTVILSIAVSGSPLAVFANPLNDAD